MPKKRNKRSDPSGLAIPAGLFIGIGLGFIFGDFVAWMFLGLGVGFLVLLIAQFLKKK